jgi:hypothetical protein
VFEFVCGIAVGAAFSPFWMMVWSNVKPRLMSFISKKEEPKQ